MRRKRFKSALFPFSGVLAGVLISFLAWVILLIFHSDHVLNYQKIILWQAIAAIPMSLLILADIPMRWGKDRKSRKLFFKHLSFVGTATLGIIGNLNMIDDLPDAFNSYTTPLWFCFGFFFYNLGGARVWDCLFYGAFYIIGLIIGMDHWDIDFGSDEKVAFLFMFFQLISFIPIAMIYRSKLAAIQHAFKQLEKVFYPHQIKRIKDGSELEQTMPTELSTAVVISFDIIESSKISTFAAKELFRNVFQRCNAIMMQNYDGDHLSARAYRIKEMGDGFLCSVGYPFPSKESNLSKEALRLAQEFLTVFEEEVKRVTPDMPTYCGIGIASGPIAGFYPATPPKEYDLYGHSIVLAKRYESMRKVLRNDHPAGSFLILQEQVFLQLDPALQAPFLICDLEKTGLLIRDDPHATRLFYRVHPQQK